MKNQRSPQKQEKIIDREALVAKKRIEIVGSSIKKIIEILEEISRSLIELISNNEKITMLQKKPPNKENAKSQNNPDKENTKSQSSQDDKDFELIFYKKRNKIIDKPERIWFKMYGIFYYIEFAIRYVKNENSNNHEGCFIYGMSYFIEKDKVMDNPLVCFFIDFNGIITAKDDFEDESWISKKEHINDLHFRTLDKIWEEGLYIINNGKF